MFRRRDPRFGEARARAARGDVAGGIYDHLGGGYARYSTDAEWLVPHFEKMLYDNAQILELLALVHAAMARPALRRARARDGRLADARDARSATPSPPRSTPTGGRGRRLLRLERGGDRRGARARPPRASRRAYDVTPRRQLGRPAPSCAASRRCGSPEEEARPRRARARSCSRSAKSAPRPGRDDKVLADWNGLAIAALARASAVFGEPDWLATARCGLRFRRRR